ncbi:GNAT family N-acetyltransferase [Pontibacter toksunensis]|uniref:GNAT family N-acetyltransferase n=1 Tax=Pontibacter toksunensis TaxID=1332631 RepID=A0ABW6BR05_9BACT
MNYYIDSVKPAEFPEVVDVWEASVRETHHFLKEEDILFYKPLILQEYLHAVDLRCVRDEENNIVGFLGVAEGNIEMLFIHPDMRGKGIGTMLLHYAVEKLGSNKVDVNEENKQAIGFYEHFGFRTISRSAFDSTGKPYPMLHMILT